MAVHIFLFWRLVRRDSCGWIAFISPRAGATRRSTTARSAVASSTFEALTYHERLSEAPSQLENPECNFNPYSHLEFHYNFTGLTDFISTVKLMPLSTTVTVKLEHGYNDCIAKLAVR